MQLHPLVNPVSSLPPACPPSPDTPHPYSLDAALLLPPFIKRVWIGTEPGKQNVYAHKQFTRFTPKQAKRLIVQSLTERRTQVPRLVLCHGTSSLFFRSILSHGLLPDPRTKAWKAVRLRLGVGSVVGGGAGGFWRSGSAGAQPERFLLAGPQRNSGRAGVKRRPARSETEAAPKRSAG